MNDSAAPDGVSAIAVAAQPVPASPKKIKIGAVARHFDVSVDLLRLYEREGLLIPLEVGRRARDTLPNVDYPWIATVLRLVREGAAEFCRNPAPAGTAPLLGYTRLREKSTSAVLSARPPRLAGWFIICCSPEDCYGCDGLPRGMPVRKPEEFIVNGPV